MTTLDINKEQLQKMKTHPGFVAALDQSGGSTPKALGSYGIKEDAWSNDDEMLAIVHQMRSRIMTSPASTASGFWLPSCSKRPWTVTSRGSLPRTTFGR